ncbi:putative fatty acyl-CoA reductase CG5065 [Daktulosphaira vitifoliae]|uniref:putative fatty acyl-CoA reductase CG5065 n=1 Tax=Daktulosphaira vitifoliae TaxID=58002 RepID=UPI0021AADD9B|nr:putative fatty acyl-CoA reductase CG5065 [Daktulosphaira vitifoliae]
MNTYEKEFLSYTPPELPQDLTNIPNRVSSTFTDKTVLITGGTGFVGKLIIENLLRKSPRVKRIYLLLRSKKEKEPKQRIEELFLSPLFDYLKKLHGNDVIEKVIPIHGDIGELYLGINENDYKILTNEVEIFYHVAATVRFDEPLKKTILLNTRGTKFTLELAKGMTNLKLFMYISTAYCHPNEKVLLEKAYSPPDDPHKMIKVIETLDEGSVDYTSKRILGDYPNGYAYSKCLAEHLIVEQIKAGLPCIICRPSIVVPIWNDPLPGWTDNLNGPLGLLTAAGKGILRSMYGNPNIWADFIPADIVVNGIQIFTWNYIENNDTERNIVNITSTDEIKITWGEIIDMGKHIAYSGLPMNNCVWYPGGSMTKCRVYHNIRVFFLQTIPAYFLDAIIYLSGNKPCLVKIQERINKGYEIFNFYVNNQWEFSSKMSRQIREKLNAREKFEYKFNLDGVDVRKYFKNSIMGARIYLLKEMPDTLPRARRHMKIMCFVHYTTQLLLFGLFLWFLMKLIKYN